MSWESIRDIGLLMFVSGGMLLFAVALGQYFDPPQPSAWIRSIFDGEGVDLLEKGLGCTLPE